MRCDDLKLKIYAGEPVEPAMREHIRACPACSDEFAWLEALASTSPRPSPQLRERVLSMTPTRIPRWWAVASAAAVLLAAGVSFAAGRATVVELPQRVEYLKVEIEKPVEVVKEVEKPWTIDMLSVLAIAAKMVYGDKKIEGEWKGVQCSHITVDPSVKEITKYCPIARELDRRAEEEPEKVAYRK